MQLVVLLDKTKSILKAKKVPFFLFIMVQLSSTVNQEAERGHLNQKRWQIFVSFCLFI